MPDMRTSVADYFRSTAAWRESKAQKYPDSRNQQWAFELNRLADHVLTLDGDDPRLARLGQVVWDEDGLLCPGEEARRQANQAFRGAKGADQALDRFVEAAVVDWQNRDPTEFDLHELVDAAGDVDPQAGLEAVGLLQRWLDNREEALVLAARVQGWPWSRIADQLRRSRQGLWEKYRDPQEGSPD